MTIVIETFAFHHLPIWPNFGTMFTGATREQSNKFQADFRNDLRIAKAGNRPYGYNPHSYTSHHRQQLIRGKFTNFRQLLGMTCELPRQETDPTVTTHTPTQVITGSS